MNIYIKNCNVTFCPGTETMNITGKNELETKTAESVIKTAETDIKNPDGVISIQRTYTLEGFLANKAAVQPGDRVRLPIFIVPPVVIDGGENLMAFEKVTIADEAVVIGKEADGSLILIFRHCLFRNEMDLNDEKEFERTQLAQYLQGAFKSMMNNAGIPAETCGLVSEKEMFGKNALEYFKDGRNRMAFDSNENCGRRYWLNTLFNGDGFGTAFCTANYYGYVGYSCASDSNIYVRPRFTIHV